MKMASCLLQREREREGGYYCYARGDTHSTLTQNQWIFPSTGNEISLSLSLLLLCLVKWSRSPRALAPVGVTPHWPQPWTQDPLVRVHRSANLTASPRRANRLAAPQRAPFWASRSTVRALSLANCGATRTLQECQPGLLCKESYPRNRQWRPIGLWDVKDPTLSRQSSHWW
jgi:hypothetical protein